MENELNDIDIIDKYLTGELSEIEERQFKQRYVNDAEFKKEVEIFRKIYEGIELSSTELLKKKLDTYYDEYAQSHTHAGRVVAINWRKTIYAVSGVAALVILVFAIYLYNQPSNKYLGVAPVQNKPGVPPNSDSGANASAPQVANISKPKDSTNALRGNNKNKQIEKILSAKGQYALTNQIALDASAIREANYPQPLSYTFNKGGLTIYGDPLLGLLFLDVFKKDGRYYLVYDNKTYSLQQTNEIKPLEKPSYQINGGGTRSSETVRVQVASLETHQYGDSTFDVILLKGGSNNTYSFTNDHGRTVLILQGNFTQDNCMVVYLKKDGKANWYIVSGQQIYATNPLAERPTALVELSGLSSEEARLFSKKDVVKTVLNVDR